jgi:hypothetical protein
MQQLAQELFEEANKRGFTSTQEAFDDLSFASDPAIQPLIEKTAKLMEQFSGAFPPLRAAIVTETLKCTSPTPPAGNTRASPANAQ